MGTATGQLACGGCAETFPIADGIPILSRSSLADGTSYASTQGQPGESRINPRLRFSSFLRRAWHAYLWLDERIAPNGPTYPGFWVGKINSLIGHPERVLDFGGGSGWFRDHLRADLDYTVLEPELASFVKQNSCRHRYVIADGHRDVFGTGTFDLILMFEVLEHVRNPFQIVQNVSKWLQPGGFFVLSTPQYWHVHGWPSDYFRYTNFGLRELCRTAGLDVVEIWPMGGPCLLIWSAIRLNFHFMDWPVLRQLMAHPSYLLARFCDFLFFRHNLARRNPDTRGWMMVAKKSEATHEN